MKAMGNVPLIRRLDRCGFEGSEKACLDVLDRKLGSKVGKWIVGYNPNISHL